MAHLEIASKVGRKLAPQLKLVIGSWLKSQFDQYLPAAAVAKKSFDLTFSGSKKTEALSFCKEDLMLVWFNSLFISITEITTTAMHRIDI